jgi:hypothetical protein
MTFFMYLYLFIFSDAAFSPGSPEKGGSQSSGATEVGITADPPPTKIRETVTAD